MKRSRIMMIAFIILAGILAAAIPPETVLVEFKGGVITMGGFNERLDNIPPMYKTRYQTNEGKAKFLSDLITEEVFYQEALAMGLQTDPGIEEKLHNQIKSTYYSEYQKYLLNEELKFTDEELEAYFLENLDEYPGITFEESRIMVEKAYRKLKSQEYLENYEAALLAEYGIEINESVLDSLDLNNAEQIEMLREVKYVTSNNPALERTVGFLKEFYEGLPNQNKRPFLQQDSRLNSIRELVKMDLYYLKASAAGFAENEVVKETEVMLRRNLILREAYNRLVTERLDVSEQKVRQYYEDNLETFSTKASRKIQAFGYKDEKTAAKYLKEAKKAVKKDTEEAWQPILSESLFEFSNGEINYIYKNNLIPKVGEDTLWCEKVWEITPGKTNPQKFSSIFQSAQGNYVFFRVLEDVLAVPTPYDEARIKIENEMRTEHSRKLFSETDTALREKYAVQIFEDNLIDKLSIEEYFIKAEDAQKKRRYQDAVFYYEQIEQFYPETYDAYKAVFMKGFLYAEELNDSEKAIKIFEEILTDYPVGELHESADFMIKELRGESDILQEMEK